MVCHKLQLNIDVCREKIEQRQLYLDPLFIYFCSNRKTICYDNKIIPNKIIPVLLNMLGK